MKFQVHFYKTSFLVGLMPNHTPINFPDMPEYDWHKPIVYDSLSAVKKSLRERINKIQLSESERYHLLLDIKDLSLESIIDDELESYVRLESELKNLRQI